MLLFALPGSILWSQKNARVTYEINLGDSLVIIHQHFNAPESNVLFFNMHEDEQTSIEATHLFSEDEKLNFIYLEHNGERRISFNVKNSVYSVDPNRIYTRKGRRLTLKDEGNYSLRASQRIRTFTKRILSFISAENIIIAMHNNTDVNYSIKSYLPGEDESANTKEVYISENWDADDFVYTTVDAYFNKLKAMDVNVILQDNAACVNDGSLSVYCGQNGIPYINIEAQKGHLDEQVKLIGLVMKMLEE